MQLPFSHYSLEEILIGVIFVYGSLDLGILLLLVTAMAPLPHNACYSQWFRGDITSIKSFAVLSLTGTGRPCL